MALMEGEHVGPFNLGNPGEFTMLELAEVSIFVNHSNIYIYSASVMHLSLNIKYLSKVHIVHVGLNEVTYFGV